MVVNRIGDVGIAIGIFLCYYIFQSIDFNVINSTSYLFQDFQLVFFNSSFHALTLLGIFLFIGAIGKSAQLGLHT
jgi:NADH:ubiquinone oxidoreductase subunit 5 (subunit L)/multisubunit Na+/H+ antiporter MnhA subunit